MKKIFIGFFTVTLLTIGGVFGYTTIGSAYYEGAQDRDSSSLQFNVEPNTNTEQQKKDNLPTGLDQLTTVTESWDTGYPEGKHVRSDGVTTITEDGITTIEQEGFTEVVVMMSQDAYEKYKNKSSEKVKEVLKERNLWNRD